MSRKTVRDMGIDDPLKWPIQYFRIEVVPISRPLNLSSSLICYTYLSGKPAFERQLKKVLGQHPNSLRGLEHDLLAEEVIIRQRAGLEPAETIT